MSKTWLLIGMMALFSSCSVIMAAKKEGTSVEKLQCCRSRCQFLSAGAIIVGSERLSTGELVETYQFLKEKGSAARALMHGVLDVSTLGLWEVVGTPMEVCVDEKVYFCLRVYYDENEMVKKVELI